MWPVRPTLLLKMLIALVCAVILTACGGSGGGSVVTVPAPDLLIRSDSSGEVRGNFNVQFFFSRPVSFPSGTLPLELSNASTVAGTFKALSTDSYQVTLAPRSNAQGLIDLRVPVGAFADQGSGTSNRVAYEFAQPYNTLAPFARLSFAGPTDVLGFITGSGTFTLGFEAVLDAPMAADKISVSAGSISQWNKSSAAGQKDSYTFVYTPPATSLGGVTFEILKGAVASGGIANDRNWWSYGLAVP